ncbi:MAG: putative Zn-dependent protease [Gammaproteobacteria bacterium]|jgi:predicted Zn-dependent protease
MSVKNSTEHQTNLDRRPRKTTVTTVCLILMLLWSITGAALNEREELPDFGDSAGAIISPEQERQLGEGFMRQMRRYAPVITDEEVEDYIQNLGMSLGELSGYYGEFTFFMLEARGINAFAVPGGFIGMHSGLLLESKSESEVASVLAHEIVHITQRHTARMIEEQQRTSIPAMAALLGAVALTALNPQAGIGALTAVQAINAQRQINFTRGNEREADRIGIQLLHEAGYNTHAMAQFFERLQTASRYTDPAFIPEILRTHPVTVNRISEAKERAERLGSAPIREDSYEYHLIRAKLDVNGSTDPAAAKRFYELALREGTNMHPSVARYGYVLALTAASNFAKARIEVAKLILESPHVLAFRIAAAQLELRAGNLPAALEHYEIAYRDDPKSRAAAYGYAEILTLGGQPEQAKDHLRNYTFANRGDPRFFKLLAEAENALGENAGSHFSLSEYYRSLGELRLALQQLRLAQQQATISNYQRLRVDARMDEINEELDLLEKGTAGRERQRQERRR